MTVLVTGACGYIGAHVVYALHQRQEEVIAVDDLSYGKKSRIGDARLIVQDIAAPEAPQILTEAMNKYGVDTVIHFAARKQVGESVEKPLWYYQQNINGTLNILEAMRDSDTKNLVFSSSAAVYGIPNVEPVTEDISLLRPINPYGETKLFSEWMARATSQVTDINVVALRYFNVAGCGPEQLEDPAILNLVPMALRNLQEEKAPYIFGDDYPTKDGTCIRDYVHVTDLADAHLAAMDYINREHHPFEVFNVGTGSGTSVKEILDEIKKATNLPFTSLVKPRRAGDPPILVADVHRIEKEMGWKARYGLSEIIESAWNAWQANPERHIDVENWKQIN